METRLLARFAALALFAVCLVSLPIAAQGANGFNSCTSNADCISGQTCQQTDCPACVFQTPGCEQPCGVGPTFHVCMPGSGSISSPLPSSSGTSNGCFYCSDWGQIGTLRHLPCAYSSDGATINGGVEGESSSCNYVSDEGSHCRLIKGIYPVCILKIGALTSALGTGSTLPFSLGSGSSLGSGLLGGGLPTLSGNGVGGLGLGSGLLGGGLFSSKFGTGLFGGSLLGGSGTGLLGGGLLGGGLLGGGLLGGGTGSGLLGGGLLGGGLLGGGLLGGGLGSGGLLGGGLLGGSGGIGSGLLGGGLASGGLLGGGLLSGGGGLGLGSGLLSGGLGSGLLGGGLGSGLLGAGGQSCSSNADCGQSSCTSGSSSSGSSATDISGSSSGSTLGSSLGSGGLLGGGLLGSTSGGVNYFSYCVLGRCIGMNAGIKFSCPLYTKCTQLRTGGLAFCALDLSSRTTAKCSTDSDCGTSSCTTSNSGVNHYCVAGSCVWGTNGLRITCIAGASCSMNSAGHAMCSFSH